MCPLAGEKNLNNETIFIDNSVKRDISRVFLKGILAEDPFFYFLYCKKN